MIDCAGDCEIRQKLQSGSGHCIPAQGLFGKCRLNLPQAAQTLLFAVPSIDEFEDDFILYGERLHCNDQPGPRESSNAA